MRLPSIHYELLTTNKCNMACKYCFQKNHGKESMSVEDVEDILNNGGFSDILLFGGEPLLNLDIIEKAINIVENSKRPQPLKEKLILKLKKQATNGTLVKKYFEKIKQLDLQFQISIDGCKEAHDSNRIFPDNSGTFEEVMSSLILLKNEGFKPTIHAVINKESIPYFCKTVKFMFFVEKTFRGLDSAIKLLSTNNLMFVIEDDYSDEDIDTLIDQFELLFKEFENEYDDITMKKIYQSFNSRSNNFCPAGTRQFLFNKNDNIYICHRSDTPLGTSDDFNPQISNDVYSAKNRETYTPYDFSASYNTKEPIPLFRCSSTYYDFNQSMFMSPVKYTVLIMELSAYLNQKVQEKCK